MTARRFRLQRDEEGNVMNCKVRKRTDRKNTRYFVELNYKGKRLKRYHDTDGPPLKSVDRAKRLARLINAEIDILKQSFTL